MVYGCSNNILKLFVFTFNFLICLGGAIIFGVSLWANLDSNFPNVIENFVSNAKIHDEITKLGSQEASLWVLVGVGGLLFLVGFLGCCGAICESSMLLVLFCVIIIILSIIEMGTAIFAITNRDVFKDELGKVLTEGAHKLQGPQYLSPIMKEFKCCGPTVEDMNPTRYNCSQVQVKQDCLTAIWNKIENLSSVSIVVALSVLAFEFLAVMFSCCLCQAFRQRSGYYYA